MPPRMTAPITPAITIFFLLNGNIDLVCYELLAIGSVYHTKNLPVKGGKLTLGKLSTGALQILSNFNMAVVSSRIFRFTSSQPTVCIIMGMGSNSASSKKTKLFKIWSLLNCMFLYFLSKNPINSERVYFCKRK